MPTRVCVVTGDYSESEGPLKDLDNIPRSPQLHFRRDDKDFRNHQIEFDELCVHKKDIFSKLRAAIGLHKYDVFFIMSDGALDEDRAGIEVLHVLEKFGQAFTGARSPFYELTKPEMKVIARRNGIETAAFAVLDCEELDDVNGSGSGTGGGGGSSKGSNFSSSASNSSTDEQQQAQQHQHDIIRERVRQRCSRLEFPLIVKHISGYSSVGMTKRNKVKNMEELEACVADFVKEYQSALVEEFVTGTEVTVLACGDSTQPDGVRVYPPVYVSFPEGEDFKHFDLKWISYEGMQWQLLPDDHPAMAEVQRVTRVAFRSMMDGVGYGRVDLRICASTNKVVFLELNPNCGIMYPLGQEASADFILELADARSDFIKLQVAEAMKYRDRHSPAFSVKLDGSRDQGWTTRATRDLAPGATVLSLSGPTTNVNLLTTSPSCGTDTSCSGAATVVAAATTNKRLSVLLNDPTHCASNVIGGIPFPRVSSSAGANGGSTAKSEVANVGLDADGLTYVALRNIVRGEEMLI